MRPNLGRVYDMTYVEFFANGVPYIQKQCEEEGEMKNWGGSRLFARRLMLIVVGRRADEADEGGVNGTDLAFWSGIEGTGVGLDGDDGLVNGSVASNLTQEVVPYGLPHGEPNYSS